MKRFNTTKKGNEFENKVFYFIEYAINTGLLGFNSTKCKLYQKKSYYSKDRDESIIFDIAIEIFLFDSPSWSLLFLFECKDYNSAIGVNDLEEFYAKVSQVAGLNVKAFFITNSKLQKSALKFAISKGISLIGSNSKFNFDDKSTFPFVKISFCLSTIPRVLSTITDLFLSKEKSTNISDLSELEKGIIEQTIKSIAILIMLKNLELSYIKSNMIDDESA